MIMDNVQYEAYENDHYTGGEGSFISHSYFAKGHFCEIREGEKSKKPI